MTELIDISKSFSAQFDSNADKENDISKHKKNYHNTRSEFENNDQSNNSEYIYKQSTYRKKWTSNDTRDIWKAIYKTEKGICCICKIQKFNEYEEYMPPNASGIKPRLWEMGHIYPHSLGGSSEFANLWAICRICNNRMRDTNFGDYFIMMYAWSLMTDNLNKPVPSFDSALATICNHYHDKRIKASTIIDRDIFTDEANRIMIEELDILLDRCGNRVNKRMPLIELDDDYTKDLYNKTLELKFPKREPKALRSQNINVAQNNKNLNKPII